MCFRKKKIKKWYIPSFVTGELNSTEASELTVT